MPVQIEGVTYFSAAEIHQELEISRQTIWRWRQEGKIPAGRRYRNRQILFTAAERQSIHEFANHLEPADAVGSRQLGLFNGAKLEAKVGERP
jgi:hypothetical protein